MEGQSEGRGRVQTGAWRAGTVQGARGGLLHVQSLLRAGGGSRAERVFRSLSGRRRKELLGDRRGSGTRDDDASGGGLTRETAETLIINPPRKHATQAYHDLLKTPKKSEFLMQKCVRL